MQKRTPLRQPAQKIRPQVDSYAAYPVSEREPVDRSPALSPQQIVPTEEADEALPSDNEAAEALGMDEVSLHEDIREEERQRHPDVHGEDEDSASVAAVAEEFHLRLSGARRR